MLECHGLNICDLVLYITYLGRYLYLVGGS